MKNIFSIPDENLHRMRAVLTRINKRATKLKCEPVTFEIGEGVREEKNAILPDGKTRRVFSTVYPVVVVGTQPVLAGWQFLGKIEHLPGTEETIVKGDVPNQYHQCSPSCDHCDKKRTRSETFILRSIDSEETKQVGRSCLKDFFNGDDPMLHAGFLQFLFDATDELKDLEDYEPGNPAGRCYDPEELLQIASAVVERDGYVNVLDAEEQHRLSTGAIVRAMLMGIEKTPEISDADRTKAQQIMAWLGTEEVMSRKAESSYFHNLCVMASTGMVGRKNIGIMASAVVAYERDLQSKQLRAAEVTSNYVGEADGKITAHAVTVTGKHFIENNYGGKCLHRFRDNEGNILVWWASGASCARVGDKIHINATVNEHSTYRDVKQTTLLRVSCTEDKLYYAVRDKKPLKQLIKLLQEPINLDHMNFQSDMTPLMCAAREGYADAVELLADAGASLDFQDKYGLCAAHFAASHGYRDVLEILRDAGADMMIASKSGNTVDSKLAVSQIVLREKAYHCQANCQDPTGRCDPSTAQWELTQSFPLEQLGDSRELADWFTLECAKAEEEGNPNLYTHLIDGNATCPIVLYVKDGKHFVWDGMHAIGAAMRGKRQTIAAIIGKPMPTLGLEQPMRPESDLNEQLEQSHG